ncbi:glycosyltransferase family 4 protein [Psychroflexus sp. CAK8W]|uniref:Glycosyltransferase family 4 protein n=1 Tax=Psychroflexus longus TaxID=2873596 RepID=A0ABS7XKD1_9FLAO|nr:glycosyltransferase family 4 protein [Psychroflexus longus]MBZ9779420.1 glycosyltransferase family 4 protein [Psychroflexus longus]
MKILFLTSELPPQPGGIGNHAHQLANYLSEFYEVSVVADQRSEDGGEEREFDSKQKFSVVRVKRKSTIVITYIQRLLTSFKLLKSNDLMLVSGKFPLWVGGVLSLFSLKPIVAIIHGSEVQLSNPLAKKLTDWSLKRLDHVISVSRFTLKLIEDLGLTSTSVIPNGFDKPKFEVEDLSIQHSEAIQLITVGNLTQRKGQHNVIKALPQLLKAYPKLIYHCVGIPTNQKQLMELAKSLNVEEYVQFHGRVTEKEKFQLLQQSDVFMMLSEQTSTGDVEGFGIAILEANSVGLPAIGSINCGIEDAIRQEYSGLLVNPHDVTQIFTAVNKIITNKSQYAKQAKAWSTHFTWDKIGKQYVEVLGEFE